MTNELSSRILKACRDSNLEELRHLVEKERIDPCERLGLYPYNTLLGVVAHCPIAERATACAEYLLSRGARVERNREGDNALDFAIQARNHSLCRLLLPSYRLMPDEDKHADTLCYAVENYMDWLVRALISDYKADPNGCMSGFSALGHAASCGSFESAQILVELGADINFKYAEDTALAIAADRNSIEVMEFLMRFGADLDLGDKCDLWEAHKAALDRFLAEIARQLDEWVLPDLSAEIVAYLRPRTKREEQSQ